MGCRDQKHPQFSRNLVDCATVVQKIYNLVQKQQILIQKTKTFYHLFILVLHWAMVVIYDFYYTVMINKDKYITSMAQWNTRMNQVIFSVSAVLDVWWTMGLNSDKACKVFCINMLYGWKGNLNACQTPRSMYLSIFNSFRVIRCLSQCVSPKIAFYHTFVFPGNAPGAIT